MEELAVELYRSHKKVLDFIMEHGARTQFAAAAESLFLPSTKSGEAVEIGGSPFVYDTRNHRQASFLPLDWHSALTESHHDWSGCKGWWGGYPLVCWLELIDLDRGTAGKLRLHAEVGPLSNSELRRQLIDGIRSVGAKSKEYDISFARGATQEGRRYSRFLKSNGVNINDITNAEEIELAMKLLLKKFQPTFTAIASDLPEILAEAATEKPNG